VPFFTVRTYDGVTVHLYMMLMAVTKPIFTKPTLAGKPVVAANFYTYDNERPTNGLLAAKRSKTDGRTDGSGLAHKAFFYFLKNTYASNEDS
jgi:hypothetical protein